MGSPAPSTGSLPAERRDDIPRAIFYVLAASFSFSLLNVLVKWQSETYSIVELVFFRSFFALIPTGIMIWHAGGWRVLATKVPGQHAARALLWLGSIYCTFGSYHALPLADAVGLGFSAPLFLTALAGPVLGETVGRHRWGAVILGFVGVLVMARPGAGMFAGGALYALGGAFLFALGSLTIRSMSRTEASLVIVFYTMLVGAVASGIVMPLAWTTPSLADFGVLAIVGIAGGLSQFCMVQAYRYAPVAVVAPFNYSQLVWAAFLGYAVWSDLPDTFVLVGSAIVIASGLYILGRETRAAPARPKEAAAAGE